MESLSHINLCMYHLTPIQIQQKNMYFTQVQNHKVFVTKLSKLLVHIELF